MATVIPAYGLYGEEYNSEQANFFNLERLPQRSSVHNWKIPPHIHKSFLQLIFIHQGSAEVYLNNTKNCVEAPSILLIPAGTVHSLQYSKDVDGPSITVSQNSIEIIARALMPNLIQIVYRPQIFSIPTSLVADSIMDTYLRIEKELKSDEYGSFYICVSLFATILIELTRMHMHATQSMDLPAISRKALLINKFLSLIYERDKVHASVKVYADEIGVTPGHLSRLCREVLGVPAIQVINNRVIQDAQKELIHTAQSIKQIADVLGFADEAYFMRFFKKHIGLSPTQFRELAVKESRSKNDISF